MAGTTVPVIFCWEMHIEDLYIYLASTKKGACRIGLSLEKQCDATTFFRKRFPGTMRIKDFPSNRSLVEAVTAVLQNKQGPRHLDFDLTCTPFQWRVLKAINRIPFGETRTYGEVGSIVGRPKGARAIGQVMAANPIPLIFP